MRKEKRGHNVKSEKRQKGKQKYGPFYVIFKGLFYHCIATSVFCIRVIAGRKCTPEEPISLRTQQKGPFSGDQI